MVLSLHEAERELIHELYAITDRKPEYITISQIGQIIASFGYEQDSDTEIHLYETATRILEKVGYTPIIEKKVVVYTRTR